jgi:hypothetical protein
MYNERTFFRKFSLIIFGEDFDWNLQKLPKAHRRKRIFTQGYRGCHYSGWNFKVSH